MKDASHHLRHIQKKVVQSQRKENARLASLNSGPHLNGQSNEKAEALEMQEKILRSR